MGQQQAVESARDKLMRIRFRYDLRQMTDQALAYLLSGCGKGREGLSGQLWEQLETERLSRADGLPPVGSISFDLSQIPADLVASQIAKILAGAFSFRDAKEQKQVPVEDLSTIDAVEEFLFRVARELGAFYCPEFPA
jgi:hypothetical protein